MARHSALKYGPPPINPQPRLNHETSIQAIPTERSSHWSSNTGQSTVRAGASKRWDHRCYMMHQVRLSNRYRNFKAKLEAI